MALDVELAHPSRLGGVGDPAIKRNHVLYVPVPMSFLFNQPLRGDINLTGPPGIAQLVNAHSRPAIARARGGA